ncbi:MAG: hypothetical protein ACLGIV_09830 [Actinomycetes bacterium]
MTRRRATWAALVAASSLLLAGCGEEPLPEPRPVEVDGPVPVVLDEQVESIRANVENVLATGDEAKDAAPLTARVDGPALQLRTARYTVARAVADQPAPTPLSGELLLDVSPAADGWPRWFLTATRPAPDAVPQIQLLTQTGPRELYKLTAWVTMLPGTTLPETSVEEPPEALPPTEPSGLVAAPADVVARYADVLTKADASEHAGAFAEDPFRTQVLGEQAAEREAVSEFFSYTVAHTPREDAVWAVRTADGGAVVLGVMDAVRTFTVTAEGAKLPLPADLAALAGTPEATKTASVTSLEMVAFVVPPEGSDDPVTVLGGERGTLAATAS